MSSNQEIPKSEDTTNIPKCLTCHKPLGKNINQIRKKHCRDCEFQYGDVWQYDMLSNKWTRKKLGDG